jgi:2-polyprenyl-3-methyl-5-hydroxy-6-metoxy-1,4-benzoquinol methylase
VSLATTNVSEFWDRVFAQGDDCEHSRVEMPDPQNRELRRAYEHFGDLNGRTLIDVGSGRGASSLFFASKGAKVISVDQSAVATCNLAEYCEKRQIKNVHPVQLSAFQLSQVGPADFVFGAMILHHLEPFSRFAEELRAALRADGKAFFFENSARSSLMIWFRQNLVGKLWVPKYGDDDEFPLTPAEVGELRRHFTVQVEIPELLFFRKISLYLLRNHLRAPFAWADRVGYRFGWLRKYSYHQYLCLR